MQASCQHRSILQHFMDACRQTRNSFSQVALSLCRVCLTQHSCLHRAWAQDDKLEWHHCVLKRAPLLAKASQKCRKTAANNINTGCVIQQTLRAASKCPPLLPCDFSFQGDIHYSLYRSAVTHMHHQSAQNSTPPD